MLPSRRVVFNEHPRWSGREARISNARETTQTKFFSGKLGNDLGRQAGAKGRKHVEQVCDTGPGDFNAWNAADMGATTPKLTYFDKIIDLTELISPPPPVD